MISDIGKKHMDECVYDPLTRYVKLRVAHAPGMPGTFSPPPRLSDLDMHHGTCLTHVPWCMPESLTSGFLWSCWREKVPGIPSACTTLDITQLARGPYFMTPLRNIKHCLTTLCKVNYIYAFGRSHHWWHTTNLVVCNKQLRKWQPIVQICWVAAIHTFNHSAHIIKNTLPGCEMAHWLQMSFV